MLMFLWRAAVYAACQLWKCCETCWDFLRHPLDYDLSLVFASRNSSTITFRDSGTVVRIGRAIAEGGFSYVHVAHVVSSTSQKSSSTLLRRVPRAWQSEISSSSCKKLALKRIHCGDEEMMQACRDEAKVHVAFDASGGHAHVLPLLGFHMESNGNGSSATCFMLFPLLPQSLRDEISARCLLSNADSSSSSSAAAAAAAKRHPWTEPELTQLFGAIVSGVHALHTLAGVAHYDVKVENVMLTASGKRPVLMDFGSARRPLRRALHTRRHVMEVVEEASSHTTISYRPPELFEGGLRAGAELDGTKVDVWSLGCLLFALQFGASPFEVEFTSKTDGIGIRIVDCTHLRVLGPLPKPPPSFPPYSKRLLDMVIWMLHPEANFRPTMEQVLTKLQEMGYNGPPPPPPTTTTTSARAGTMTTSSSGGGGGGGVLEESLV